MRPVPIRYKQTAASHEGRRGVRCSRKTFNGVIQLFTPKRRGWFGWHDSPSAGGFGSIRSVRVRVVKTPAGRGSYQCGWTTVRDVRRKKNIEISYENERNCRIFSRNCTTCNRCEYFSALSPSASGLLCSYGCLVAMRQMRYEPGGCCVMRGCVIE